MESLCVEKRQFSPPWCHQALAPFHLWLLSSVSFLTFLCQKVRIAFIHPLGFWIIWDPDTFLVTSLTDMGTFCVHFAFPGNHRNSSISQEKWADLRCPPQDIPWDRVQMLGCSLLCSDGPKTGSRSCLCHLQDRGATCATSALRHPTRSGFAAVFWTKKLNQRTAEAVVVSKNVISKTPTTSLKSDQKSQVHWKYLLLSV